MAGPANTSSFIHSLLHRAMKDCSHHHPTETLSFCCIPHSASSPLLLGSDNCVRVHVPDSSAQSTIPSLIVFSFSYIFACFCSEPSCPVCRLLALSLSLSLTFTLALHSLSFSPTLPFYPSCILLCFNTYT
ncbi:uncharacterized protein BO96DRAFT_231512 [Aspergillus niger CBS 101883]|uniref:Uncharacterized protein n=1 Tax=Aspergillus niger ATCC 13496 TaxID=1353008 RepID=A0A370BUP2_ASPNG|nr:uncharacterized protein BO96DRAFT_231512 [Aspergillus niger CBS 101883]PYH59005.1 hypothetical protein BO96DRAFT_231512 [Aspergillus niger CBS 101883]RDH19226.1 hypothetical protein M747DRAFT_67912 [Aspergillus niger ATCC 13496]